MAVYVPSILSVIFVCSLALGIYILRRDPRKRIHQLFFAYITIIAFFNFFVMMGVLSQTREDFLFWYRMRTFTMLFLPLTLHINMEILGITRRPKVFFLSACYLINAFFMYRYFNLDLVYKDFVNINGVWSFVKTTKSSFFLLYVLFVLSCYAFTFIMQIMAYRRTKREKEKKQALVLFISFLFYFIFLIIEFGILPIFSVHHPGLHSVYLFIIPAGIATAIIKYKFLSVTPESVSREIIDNIDESVMLLDTNLKLVFANRKTWKITGGGGYAKIEKIIAEYNTARNQLRRILDGETSKLSLNLNYKTCGGEGLRLMSLRITAIQDRFDEITGILIIGREVTGASEFRLRFGLTKREMSVITHLAAGKSNKDIANVLAITENTVKSHIDHIYNKTGVVNRIELINLLNEFDVRL
jgi:DNA-binding CsgD family transcriptional regulator